jgi:hypothetical protein
MVVSSVLNALLDNVIVLISHCFLIVTRFKLKAPLQWLRFKMLENFIYAISLEIIQIDFLQRVDRHHPTRESCQLLSFFQVVKNCLHQNTHVDMLSQLIKKLNEYDAGLLHIKCVPNTFLLFDFAYFCL